MSEFVPLEPLVTEWRVVALFPDNASPEPFPLSGPQASLELAEIIAEDERDHRLPVIYGKRRKIFVSIESRLVGPWSPT